VARRGASADAMRLPWRKLPTGDPLVADEGRWLMGNWLVAIIPLAWTVLALVMWPPLSVHRHPTWSGVSVIVVFALSLGWLEVRYRRRPGANTHCGSPRS
jgi:hypothetical protein